MAPPTLEPPAPATSRPPVPPAEAAALMWACPCCQAALRAAAGGQRGTCPACGALIEAPDPRPAAATQPGTTPPSPPLRPPRGRKKFAVWSRRRLGRLIGMLAVLGALAAAASWFHRARPWSQMLGPDLASVAPRPATTAELQEKLQRFLNARDWAAKRSFVLDAARLDHAGVAYYDGRDPDRIDAAAFTPWSLPTFERLEGVAVLRAERPDRRPVLAVFRESDGGWLLDWELFCQTYDEALPAYLAQPSFPIRTFRARLGRVFHDAGTDPSGYAIELSDPLDPGQRLTIDLPPGTPIMRSVAGGLQGMVPREATVQVSWARPDPEGEWVPMLQRLVCWGWDGLNGRPESTSPAAPAHERSLLPTTAPRTSPAPPAELTLAATERL